MNKNKRCATVTWPWWLFRNTLLVYLLITLLTTWNNITDVATVARDPWLTVTWRRCHGNRLRRQMQTTLVTCLPRLQQQQRVDIHNTRQTHQRRTNYWSLYTTYRKWRKRPGGIVL